MNDALYVAWQDTETREWIPVAFLRRVSNGYTLQYTKGAQRCKSFVGLGRMSSLEKTYFSEMLFPFFANRMISKSRPEYKSYLRWLGLDDLIEDPMAVMSVTGGIRATDSFEIVPAPQKVDGKLKLDFFPRGQRHLPTSSFGIIEQVQEGERLYLMQDVQNSFDPNALMVRTDSPKALIGYLPRYYCVGLSKIIASDPQQVEVHVKKANPDAPLDMKLLCTLTGPWLSEGCLHEGEDDFELLAGNDSRNFESIQGLDLSIS